MYADDERKSAAMLFGRTLASLSHNQPAGRAPSVEPAVLRKDVVVTTSEGTSPDDTATPSGML